jgi:hypothetical protein
MENRQLEIPVSPIVKAYFSHSSNLGDSAVIEQRHWLARHICSVVSYHPLDKADLPIHYQEKNLEKLTMFSFSVSFPLKIDQLTMHHYCLLGQVLESVFELSVINFCKGRFSFSLNYSAAIDDFFKKYDLDKVDYEKDNYRRFINKKYGSSIQDEYKNQLKNRDKVLQTAKKI